MTQSASANRRYKFATLLVVTCLVTFTGYFAVSMRLPLVPLHARQYGITTSQIGIINSVFFFVAGLLSIQSGFLLDRFGRRRLAISGPLILAFGLCFLFFTRSFLQIGAIYLLLGIGTAAFGPTMMTFVAEISPPSHLGRAYGWYTTAVFGGMGMGPAAAGILGQWLGLGPVFLIAGVLCGLTAWGVTSFLKFEKAKIDIETAEPLHRNLARLATNRPLLGCWLITLGICISTGIYTTFLPLHAQDHGLSVGQIGMVFFVNSVVNALSRIPFGYWSDRVSQRKHLANAGVAVIALSMIGFGPAKHLSHFMVAALFLGVSTGLTFTSVGALTAETVNPGQRGAALGGYYACIFFGMMLGSVTFGPVIESLGFAVSFMLTGLVNFLFIILFYWLLHNFRPR